MSALENLGWANAGGETYEKICLARDKCLALGHERSDIDVGPPHRGMEHVVTCELCGYVYRYDSSD